MNEYKFRGFDAVGNKGWVYGDLVHNKKVTRTGLEDRVMVGGYEVVPESVGIRLVKFGDTEIYEGDILRWRPKTFDDYLFTGRAFYNTALCAAVVEHSHGIEYLYNVYSNPKMTIIGNIYENPNYL